MMCGERKKLLYSEFDSIFRMIILKSVIDNIFIELSFTEVIYMFAFQIIHFLGFYRCGKYFNGILFVFSLKLVSYYCNNNNNNNVSREI